MTLFFNIYCIICVSDKLSVLLAWVAVYLIPPAAPTVLCWMHFSCKMGNYLKASEQDLKNIGISITIISYISTTKFEHISLCLLYIHITAKPLIYEAPIRKTYRLVLQLSLPNPLKPGVKWRMKMQLEVLRCHYHLYVVGRDDINTIFISALVLMLAKRSTMKCKQLSKPCFHSIYLILWRRCVASLVEVGVKRDFIMTPWHSEIQ